MPLTYPGWSVNAGDQPPASKWNQIGTNMDSLAAGSGLNTNAVTADKLAVNAITLGKAKVTSGYSTTSNSWVQVPGMTVSVTIPSGGRDVEILVFFRNLSQNTNGAYSQVAIWDGTVGSGTMLSSVQMQSASSGGASTLPCTCIASVTPSAGAKTYNVGIVSNLGGSGGTASVDAASVYPGLISVKVV